MSNRESDVHQMTYRAEWETRQTGSGAAFQIDLIVGGVQKAGTTTLFSYMQDHLELCPPSRKETHFFDNEQLDWASPDWTQLAAFYACSNSNQIRFDVTPIYLFWPPSLERIQAHNPNVRLIFLFRDPIERAWSHWRMETRRGGEDLPFSTAIRQGRWRLRGIPQLDHAWRVYSYVERGFYGQQIRRVLSLFHREQLLFISADDLSMNHQGVLDRIAAFAGISEFKVNGARREHVAPPSEQLLAPEDTAYLRTIFREDLLDFSMLSKVCVQDWLTMREDVL